MPSLRDSDGARGRSVSRRVHGKPASEFFVQNGDTRRVQDRVKRSASRLVDEPQQFLPQRRKHSP